jgi:hypothetical protein
MEWFTQGVFILIVGWAAEAAWPRICSGIGPLLDSKPLNPIYSLNRRFHIGFKTDRKQPDPNPLSYRISDNICHWPRLLS